MSDEPRDKRIAFLTANEGVEQIELTEPMRAVRNAGGEADASDYDGLVLPGRVANPDRLRTEPDAVEFIRAFFEAGKPVGVTCHGPWSLIDAGVVRGRTLTSWPSLETDLRNAGAEWVDEQVHVDRGLVSSRKPDDPEAFNAKIVEEFREGFHQGQQEQTAEVAG
jgi:protease I